MDEEVTNPEIVIFEWVLQEDTQTCSNKCGSGDFESPLESTKVSETYKNMIINFP